MQLRRYTLVRLVIQDGEKVCLLRQAIRNGGKYALVGGKIQLRETPVQAIIRETREECGIEVLPEDLEFHQYIYQRKSSFINMILVFRTRKWTGELINAEPHKFIEAGWYSIHDLPKRTTKSTRYVLNNLKSNKQYTELASKHILVK